MSRALFAYVLLHWLPPASPDSSRMDPVIHHANQLKFPTGIQFSLAPTPCRILC